MKKILIKILSCALCLCLLGSVLTGCKDSKWTATKMNDWGAVVSTSTGGFMAETEKYVYYINGVANSSADNTYGVPVKGALMVADKADPTKTEIAVPKLFAASDFDAGIYIFGDYVYYGTPSTDKTPDGTVAKTEMMFRRAKLDGSSDELLFSVSSLSYEYRIAAKGNDVYIVYYDSSDKAIVSYSVSEKSKTIVAKTDEKTSGKETLATYAFLENEMLGQAVVVYTTTVYQLGYNEDMNEGTESTRPTESYNKVYVYSAGDVKADDAESVGKLIYDGSAKEETYSILLNDENFVYVQKTDKYGDVTVSAVKGEQLLVAGAAGTEIVADYAVSGNLITPELDAYILSSSTDSDGESTGPVKIYKDTAKVRENDTTKINHTETKELVAMCDTISSLLFVRNDYLYYYNTSNQICKIYIGNDQTAAYKFGESTVNYDRYDAMEIRISEDTVSTAWYDPEIVELGDKEYLFYCDNSASGLSYIKYIDIDGEVIGEDDVDDDDEDKATTFYLEGAEFFGKVLDADKADIFESKISALANQLSDGCLVFDTDADGAYVVENGNLKVSAVEKVRVEYEALAGSVKENVSSSSIEALEEYERAIEIASLLYKLDGIVDYDNLDDAKQAEFEAVYESIKAEMEEYYDSDEYSDIGGYIENDLKANYSKACDIFDPEEDAE